MLWTSLALALIAGWACGPGTGQPAADEEIVEPAAEAESPAVEDVEAKLALADAFDGTVDGIVARCPGCALGMDGSAEHTLRVAGHELRFCSASCMESFADEPEARILALVIPDISEDSAGAAGADPEG
jgi:hypothetical protein